MPLIYVLFSKKNIVNYKSSTDNNLNINHSVDNKIN